MRRRRKNSNRRKIKTVPIPESASCSATVVEMNSVNRKSSVVNESILERPVSGMVISFDSSYWTKKLKFIRNDNGNESAAFLEMKN